MEPSSPLKNFVITFDYDTVSPQNFSPKPVMDATKHLPSHMPSTAEKVDLLASAILKLQMNGLTSAPLPLAPNPSSTNLRFSSENLTILITSPPHPLNKSTLLLISQNPMPAATKESLDSGNANASPFLTLKSLTPTALPIPQKTLNTFSINLNPTKKQNMRMHVINVVETSHPLSTLLMASHRKELPLPKNISPNSFKTNFKYPTLKPCFSSVPECPLH